jgi:hypothetical protein
MPESDQCLLFIVVLFLLSLGATCCLIHYFGPAVSP